MQRPHREITIIGAGVIGSALAYRLAQRGHRVRMLDPQAPGQGGASYGNVGHLAAELVEPLPSPQLLLGFVKELTIFGGPLHMPMRNWPALLPWALRFVIAAFRRSAHTRLLTPLVLEACAEYQRLLDAIGRGDLLRRDGHYQIWSGPEAQRAAQAEATHMQRLGVPTAAVDASWLAAQARLSGEDALAALHFPSCGHVTDPAAVVQALAAAAVAAGASIEQRQVRSVQSHGAGVRIDCADGVLDSECAVICAGIWSADLLRGHGLKVPLQAAYGYHVELPGAPARIEAPILYCAQRLLVTPMAGRLRASSFMEFSGLHSKVDAGKYQRLDALLAGLGYPRSDPASHWRGPRPILPDYLPGLGQVPGQPLYYAIGHQHLGLTMAPITAELMADAISGTPTRVPLAPFDLRRFD